MKKEEYIPSTVIGDDDNGMAIYRLKNGIQFLETKVRLSFGRYSCVWGYPFWQLLIKRESVGFRLPSSNFHSIIKKYRKELLLMASELAEKILIQKGYVKCYTFNKFDGTLETNGYKIEIDLNNMRSCILGRLFLSKDIVPRCKWPTSLKLSNGMGRKIG